MRNILLLSFAMLLPVLGGCSSSRAGSAEPIYGANPENGTHLAVGYGCGSCHEIPGLRGATGQVAPPLRRVARRAYITGNVPNTPANLIRWIRAPRNVDARTIMPDMNISDAEARDIAAFLYTLD